MPRTRTHQAKCTSFQRCYADFVLAINADPTDLKYQLYAEGLITLEARSSGSADQIASSCESKLRYDESKWDQLIGVLRRCDGGGIIAARLMDRLRELLGENAPGGDIPRAQQQNRGESPCCITIIAKLSHCCVACTRACWEKRAVHGRFSTQHCVYMTPPT